jgi:hypothetical protein
LTFVTPGLYITGFAAKTDFAHTKIWTFCSQGKHKQITGGRWRFSCLWHTQRKTLQCNMLYKDGDG